MWLWKRVYDFCAFASVKISVQSLLDIDWWKSFLFFSVIVRLSLYSGVVILLLFRYLIEKIGKWSEMSLISMPFSVSKLWMVFEKILSMIEAEWLVTRVGLQICGINEWTKFVRMKSLVGEWVSVFNRSRLKSPLWMDSLFSFFIMVRISESLVLKVGMSDPGRR